MTPPIGGLAESPVLPTELLGLRDATDWFLMEISVTTVRYNLEPTFREKTIRNPAARLRFGYLSVYPMNGKHSLQF